MQKKFLLLWSSVGRKYLMALTGLIWIGFVTGHLFGNLTLFVGAETFNKYSHKLISLGPILWVVELSLVAFLVLHIASGIPTWYENTMARKKGYEAYSTAGGASKQTLSSTTMIYSGAILLVFIVLHVWMFKYGNYYETVIDGKKMRDLYTLVIERFQEPLVVVLYVAAMIFLGLHLRHGFWSGFQSLGLNGKVFTPFIQSFAVLYAILFALGYIVLPVWVYFGGGR